MCQKQKFPVLGLHITGQNYMKIYWTETLVTIHYILARITQMASLYTYIDNAYICIVGQP